MEATEKQLEKAAVFFETNPLCKKVLATSDNFLFIQERSAKVHAKTLDNNTVVTITSSKEDFDPDQEDQLLYDNTVKEEK